MSMLRQIRCMREHRGICVDERNTVDRATNGSKRSGARGAAPPAAAPEAPLRHEALPRCAPSRQPPGVLAPLPVALAMLVSAQAGDPASAAPDKKPPVVDLKRDGDPF